MARPKGVPNKNKAFLLDRLKDQLGKDFDPIINAAKNAARMQKLADNAEDNASDDEFDMRKDTVSAWEKIAQYVEPKLKAIEVDVSGAIDINEPTDAERASRVATIFDQARARRDRQLDS